MLISKYLEHYGQDVVTCSPRDTAKTVAALIAKHHIGAVPVCSDDGEIVGIVSERDLVRKLDEIGGGVVDTPVAELMTRQVRCCKPDQPMADVRQLMHKHGFRHVPVVEGYKVLAVISVRDALRIRLDQKELEANVLKDSMIAARHR